MSKSKNKKHKVLRIEDTGKTLREKFNELIKKKKELKKNEEDNLGSQRENIPNKQ